MHITIEKRIEAFERLGASLQKIINTLAHTPLSEAEKSFKDALEIAPYQNPWFTPENIHDAIIGLTSMLKPESLSGWHRHYSSLQENKPVTPKKVAVIMAGNIPLVGFHDFMCVLISGNSFLGKLSSQDKLLPVKLANILIDLEPGFKGRIEFSENPIKDFDAVIATGSNNSARYFDYYFGKYPHIIRRNRNSVAVLTGKESPEQLNALGKDVFMYFGLGCRNVSKIYIPESFRLEGLLDQWESYNPIQNHNKYMNNYEYNKAVFLVNGIKHYDNGFLLLKEDQSLISPLAVLHYDYYKDTNALGRQLSENKDKIQCLSSSRDFTETGIPCVRPGEAQFPTIHDYADGIDTMEFLIGLGENSELLT